MVAKVEFPIGKKLFPFGRKPRYVARCPTVDLELVQTTRNVNGTRLTPFGNSNRENGPTFLDFPLFLGIFQWDEPTKRVPFTAGPEIAEILTKWKAPRISAVVPGIFQWDEPKTRLPFASQPEFPGIRGKW